MADNDFASDEEIINLTELIESGANASKTGGAAAYAKAAATIQEDNFKDYLSDLDMGNDETESVDADEKLDMAGMGDIENLLDSFDIPAQPQGAPVEEPVKPTAAAPKEEESASDLDTLLDDLLMSGEEPAKKEAPPKAKETAKTEAPIDEIDADLNSILLEAGNLVQEQTSQQPAEAVSDTLDLNFDMPEIAADAQTPLSDISDEIGNEKAPAADFFAENELSVGQAANNAEAVKPDLNAEARGDSPGNPEPFVVQPVQELALAPETLATICTGIIKAQGIGAEETIRDFAHKLGFQAARMEDMTRRMEELASALQESSRELQTAREKIAALEKEASEQLNLKALLEEGTPLNNGFMGIISSSVASALQNVQPASAEHLENRLQEIETHFAPFDENLANVETRLQVLEEALGKDENEIVKIADLQDSLRANEEKLNPVRESLGDIAERLVNVEARLNSMPATGVGALSEELIARIDSLETQESGFLAKFASIEGRLDSLEAGLSAASLKLNEVNLEGLPENLQKLSIVEKSLNARMDAMEKRLDSLEPGFNGEIEKAAARAVAKILHEEIARLTAGD